MENTADAFVEQYGSDVFNDFMHKMYGYLVSAEYDDVTIGPGRLEFTRGSARILLTMRDTDYGPAAVVAAPILQRVALVPELIQEIAFENRKMIVARLAVSLPQEGAMGATLWLEATLFAPTLDPPELEFMVRFISNTADELDDRLQIKYGGLRAQDAGGIN